MTRRHDSDESFNDGPPDGPPPGPGTRARRTALLLVNPASRGGGGDTTAAMAQLQAAGVDVVHGDPEASLDAQIRAQAGSVDCVIVGGGDGSLNAAAAALADTGLPLGILPMGTANDLARTLQLPGDLAAAAEVIGQGHLARIDLARINGRHFFNVANIGLGAASSTELDAATKQRLGVFSYLASVIRAIRTLRPFHAHIVCDGRRRRVHSIQIAVGNGRHYGGGMVVAEQARIDDQLFFLYSVPPLTLWEMLRLIPGLRRGRFHPGHGVLIEQGRRVQVHTRKRKPVSADGEAVTHTPARFTIRPRAVAVYVPASYCAGAESATSQPATASEASSNARPCPGSVPPGGR